jgi:hypothetical protein
MTEKTTSKPRSAAKAPAKRGPGRPRKDGAALRQHAHMGRAEGPKATGQITVDESSLDSFRQALGRGLAELLQEPPRVIRGRHILQDMTHMGIVRDHNAELGAEPMPARPIDEALAELGLAIADMTVLTDDESEALAAVLVPELTTGDEPGPPLPVSKLAAQITDAARRIEKCNAYRRARLARIDLPRG